jgi:hypothetical protein
MFPKFSECQISFKANKCYNRKSALTHSSYYALKYAVGLISTNCQNLLKHLVAHSKEEIPNGSQNREM